MKDIKNQKLVEGDEVTLLRVTDPMISGLPEEEIAFLRAMEGKTATVSEIDEVDVEVMMIDPDSGIIHFLRLTGSDVELKRDRSNLSCASPWD